MVLNHPRLTEKYKKIPNLYENQERTKECYLQALTENKEYGLLLKNLQQFDDLWESELIRNKNEFMNRHEKILGALLRVIVNNVDRFNYHS